MKKKNELSFFGYFLSGFNVIVPDEESNVNPNLFPSSQKLSSHIIESDNTELLKRSYYYFWPVGHPLRLAKQVKKLLDYYDPKYTAIIVTAHPDVTMMIYRYGKKLGIDVHLWMLKGEKLIPADMETIFESLNKVFSYISKWAFDDKKGDEEDE